jgi:hypothetical protein
MRKQPNNLNQAIAERNRKIALLEKRIANMNKNKNNMYRFTKTTTKEYHMDANDDTSLNAVYSALSSIFEECRSEALMSRNYIIENAHIEAFSDYTENDSGLFVISFANDPTDLGSSYLSAMNVGGGKRSSSGPLTSRLSLNLPGSKLMKTYEHEDADGIVSNGNIAIGYKSTTPGNIIIRTRMTFRLVPPIFESSDLLDKTTIIFNTPLSTEGEATVIAGTLGITAENYQTSGGDEMIKYTFPQVNAGYQMIFYNDDDSHPDLYKTSGDSEFGTGNTPLGTISTHVAEVYIDQSETNPASWDSGSENSLFIDVNQDAGDIRYQGSGAPTVTMTNIGQVVEFIWNWGPTIIEGALEIASLALAKEIPQTKQARIRKVAEADPGAQTHLMDKWDDMSGINYFGSGTIIGDVFTVGTANHLGNNPVISNNDLLSYISGAGDFILLSKPGKYLIINYAVDVASSGGVTPARCILSPGDADSTVTQLSAGVQQTSSTDTFTYISAYIFETSIENGAMTWSSTAYDASVRQTIYVSAFSSNQH